MSTGSTSSARTMREVAARAGVSVATVSRVANGNYPVSAATKERVRKAMHDLGYVLDDNARALAGTGSRLIVLVLNELVDPFYSYIARGVQLEATAHGRACLVIATSGVPGSEATAIDLAMGRRADMIILVGGSRVDADYQKAIRRHHRRLSDHGIQLVLCGRPSIDDDRVPSVQYENESGAFTVTEHLIRRGHRRILYLGGPTGLSTTEARVAGYRRALTEHGITPDDRLVRIGQFGREWSRHTMLAALDEDDLDFTAVFAGNDICAAGVYAAVKSRGLRVPADLSVVGYDDVPLAVDLDPPLTTVNVPLEALGREAVRLGLLGDTASADPFARDRSQARLGVYLVERDSVGAPAADRAV